MSETPLPEPLDDFLGNPPAVPASIELRGDLLRQTAALVRRRRWKRRVAALAAVAAMVVLTVVAIWRFSANEAGLDKGPQPVAKGTDSPPKAPVDEPPTVAPAPPAPPSALALEWQAFDAPQPRRAALYQRAGDRYVEEESDLASALRCYGQAVQTAHADELQIDPDDNWLVMALKMDQIQRRKER